MLKKPSLDYKKSFLEAFKQYKDYNFNEEEIFLINTDFEAYINIFKDYEKGINLPKNWLAFTALWVIQDEKFVGRINIRHLLPCYENDYVGHIGIYIIPPFRNKGIGKQALAESIQYAKRLYKQGILETYNDKLSIPCLKNNIASKTIIEANAGVFDKEYELLQKNEKAIFTRFLIGLNE